MGRGRLLLRMLTFVSLGARRLERKRLTGKKNGGEVEHQSLQEIAEGEDGKDGLFHY